MTSQIENLNAEWIGLDWPRDAQPVGGHPIALRRDIELPCAPQSARLRVTGSPRYALWINGQIVNYGPARSYPNRLAVDELDISPFLKSGTNHFAALVLPNTGIAGYSVVARLGFLMDGEAVCDGEVIAFGSDTDWRARAANWYLKTDYVHSLPTVFQEHFDAHLEQENWKTVPPAEGWLEAFYIGPVGINPWHNLEARPIPLLREEKFSPQYVWKGQAPRELEPIASNLAQRFNEQAVAGQAIEATEHNQQWIASDADNVHVFDFGRTRLIRPGIEVEAATEGTRLEIFCGLGLEDRPFADKGFQTEREGACDSFTPAGEGSWEALAPKGFRFLTVKVSGGSCRFRLAAKTVDYPFGELETFRCDDPLLEKIWQISADTLRSATNDAIVDTCSRENVLWTIDACMSAKAAFYTFGETAMWRRCLQLIAQGIAPDGTPNAVVPSSDSFMTLYDQALGFVAYSRDYYQATADESLMGEIAPAIGRLLARCQSFITEEDLFIPPSGSWHWVDWAALNHEPYALAINCLLLRAARSAQLIAEVAHDAKLSQSARQIDERLTPALIRFYDEEKGCFSSNLEPKVPFAKDKRFWVDPSDRLTHDLHGNALACELELGTHEQRQRTADFIAHCLSQPLNPQNGFGPGWTATILAPLWEFGHTQTALDFVRLVYGRIIEVGSPTWQESFHPARYNTAHGWGSCVNTLLAEKVAGLRIEQAGCGQLSFQPDTRNLTSVHYELTTPAGRVALNYERGHLKVNTDDAITIQ